MELAEAHLERGKGYARHAMWDDAIRELLNARDKAPESAEIALELAEAYAARWRESYYPEDRRLARDAAHACINNDPENARGFELLAELERSEGGDSKPDGATVEPSPGAKPKSSPGRVFSLLGIAALIIAGGVAGFITETEYQSEPPPPAPRLVPTDPVPVAPPDEAPLELPGVQTVQLPVTVAPHAGSGELDVVVRKSELKNYSENSFYTLWVDVVNRSSNAELVGLQLTAELLDEAGAPVTSGSWAAWAGHEPRLRPGDKGVAQHLLRAHRDAKAVRLTVDDRKFEPAAEEYPAAQPLELTWKTRKPEGADVAAKLRWTDFSKSVFEDDSGYLRANYEFHNTGEVPIELLKIRVDLLAADGSVLDSNDQIVTYSSKPPIEAGEMRLESTIRKVGAGFQKLEITVLEIEAAGERP